MNKAYHFQWSRPLGPQATLAVLYAAAALLLIVSMAWAWHVKSFLNKAVVAEGTVIDIVSLVDRSRHRWERTYAPLFRFRTRDGQTIDAQSPVSTSWQRYDKGQVVAVVYDPDDPQRADILSFWTQWLGAIITGGLACFILGLTGMVHFVLRHHA